MTLAIIFIVVFAFMIVEAIRAAANERMMLSMGGLESNRGDVYDVMRFAYPGAFLAMLIEGALRGGPPTASLAIGGAIFALAKALKWWAILTLDVRWTFRVITITGAPRIRHGPYRHLSHPNYVAVVGELVGVVLMTGAWIAGPVATVLFGALILKRLAVENNALRVLR